MVYKLIDTGVCKVCFKYSEFIFYFKINGKKHKEDGKLMRIELYLNSERGVVKGVGRKNLPPLGYSGQIGKKYDSWHVKKTFAGFSEEEIEIRDQLEHIAEQHNVEFRVYDVKKTSHAFRAWYKGVREIPTIIIGKQKFGEDFKEYEILRVLEEN